MPKQVKGKEGDLGKPFAGQKRDRATRAEEVCQHPMSGDEFLIKLFKDWKTKYNKLYKTSDEENERFKLWCATKQRMDAKRSDGQPAGILHLNSFSDWTDYEKEQASLGRPMVPYECKQHTPEFYELKVDEVLACRMCTRFSSRRSKEARDELMYKMFKGWAKKHKKSYETAVEENKRFKIWCSTKERIDAVNSSQPGGDILGLNFLSDFTNFERAEYRGGSILVDDPYNGNEPTPEFYESKLGKKVAEEEMAFDKWVKEHNIEYDSEWEREERFAAYFRNKTRIDTLRKENPGCYSKYPHELDMMMDCVLNINKLITLLSSDPSNQGCSTPLEG